MRIALADTLKPNVKEYVAWIRRVLTDAEMVILSSNRQNLADFDGCDGVVLTGGSDVHPKFYGRVESVPMAINPNESRDEFEFVLIKRALAAGAPVLGICRGMQAFNVALGGTLIPDVQTAGFRDHGKGKGSKVDSRHGVRLEPATVLESIARTPTGNVNSSHHQAVDKPGRGLKVSAWSDDGVVEGMQWEEPQGKPFLQLVQWHPERMEDYENPLSRGLLERFAQEVQRMTGTQEPTLEHS